MAKENLIYELDLANEQLSRMRGMTRYYHQRFFSDVRYTTSTVLALLLVGFWAVPESFLLIPVAALIGANQTAFDASYLYFARHYAAELESEINSSMRRQMLVGAEIENAYLFPLKRRKLVGVAVGEGFSWFGWVTVFYTLLGTAAFGFGIALGWSRLVAAGPGWTVAYLGGLGLLTLGSLAAGWWWFAAGTGEARLQTTLESHFGRQVAQGSVTPLKG